MTANQNCVPFSVLAESLLLESIPESASLGVGDGDIGTISGLLNMEPRPSDCSSCSDVRLPDAPLLPPGDNVPDLDRGDSVSGRLGAPSVIGELLAGIG